jgi:NAD(P)-dependent dehydrogenase (short-subunit alcohol dehydrogenase family)
LSRYSTIQPPRDLEGRNRLIGHFQDNAYKVPEGWRREGCVAAHGMELHYVFGTPEDIAGAALFLASELSSFITGEFIIVTGRLPLSPARSRSPGSSKYIYDGSIMPVSVQR